MAAEGCSRQELDGPPLALGETELAGGGQGLAEELPGPFGVPRLAAGEEHATPLEASPGQPEAAGQLRREPFPTPRAGPVRTASLPGRPSPPAPRRAGRTPGPRRGFPGPCSPRRPAVPRPQRPPL